MEAWIDLSVLLAQGVDTDNLKKDQAEVTARFLAKRWQWDQMKVNRWLKLREKRGSLHVESRSQHRHQRSIITILRPFESDTVNDTFLKKHREAIPVLGAENGSREAVEDRISSHCLEYGHWRGFTALGPEESARKKILKRIKSGYSEEQLLHYVDVYNSKRMAHKWYEQRFKEAPSPLHRFWCPNPGWSILNLFTRDRYFPIWIDEGEEPVTKEELTRFEDREIESLYQ